ncbi:MAG TPA: carboxypeptidase-like regulatory domain-containing protein, partial [Terriglobales bacterium]|nr:carboxypeptidase-like regulatory domain-containing protein [Terriglobales bacterium]
MSTLAWAQSGTTSLRGTITDPSQASVSGAKVTLANPERGFQRTTTTNATGAYEFLQLQPGTYHITVEMTGFRKAEQKQIELLVDTPSTLNIRLDVGATTETVEVTGEAPVINTTDASVGNAFSEAQVKSLPMEGRNVPDLLSLQAGVAYTGNRTDIDTTVDTRSGAVNGARSDQSNITLDGVDVNDNNGGDAFTSVLPITADSVQEFRVTTSNYNADEGRSSGAQVSLVTKSGTNKFHGAAYEYHRNTVTSANDYFVKGAQIAAGEPNQPLKLIRNIFGGAIGGPIIKDRLFFFANYEGARQREENSALRVVPSDTLRDGVMVYQCADTTQCAGMSVQGKSGQSYSIPAGFYGLSP